MSNVQVPNFLQPHQCVNFLYMFQANVWNLVYSKESMKNTMEEPVWWIKVRLTEEQIEATNSRFEWLKDWPITIQHSDLLIAEVDKHEHIAAILLPRWDATMTDKHYAATYGYMAGQKSRVGTYWGRFRGQPWTDQEKQDYLVYKGMAMEEN